MGQLCQLNEGSDVQLVIIIDVAQIFFWAFVPHVIDRVFPELHMPKHLFIKKCHTPHMEINYTEFSMAFVAPRDVVFKICFHACTKTT